MRKSLITAAALALALSVSACSSGGGTEESADAKTDTETEADADTGEGRGPITYAQGKDTSGALQAIIDDFNADHPGEEVTFVELPESADDQRTALVQDFQAGAGTYDVAGLDVIWTAEFAARDWLLPLDDVDTNGLFQSTVDSGTYEGTLFAAPYKTNASLLFYRSDLLDEAPTTWDELIKDCEVAVENDMKCYATQLAQYEGLTVAFSEVVNSAGGAILDAEGNVDIDTPQADEGVSFLSNGLKEGYIPEEVMTFMEEESRRAFQSGDYLFLRNWPYVYNLAEEEGEDSQIQGKFEVALIPGASGVGASTLGGYNIGVSKVTPYPATAQDFINYMLSEPVQKRIIQETGEPPVRESLYSDEELVKEIPYFEMLGQAIEHAVARPQAVAYSEFSQALSENFYKDLQAGTDPAVFLPELQSTLQKVVETN
ncbi:ABC transporter substrate-binding protein [Scrofimicrobium canadense]|uniref:ABC transporter substrate-binding protein n=1 Tax=Scrofimicrobium canadense TaxID=2652290 RepID=UPI0012B316CA|nr:ABC transporter substrate-binding protein [Scrofimicrobium canadense]